MKEELKLKLEHAVPGWGYIRYLVKNNGHDEYSESEIGRKDRNLSILAHWTSFSPLVISGIAKGIEYLV